MSVKNISKSLTSSKDINPNTKPRWTRNPNWLTLGTSAGNCYALLAVLPESNHTSIYVSSTAYPCYIVWNDGSVNPVQEITTAGTYSRTYDYNTFDPTNSTLITHNGLTYKQAIVYVYGNGNVTINFNQNQGLGSPLGSSGSANTTSNWLDIQSNGQDINNNGPTIVNISSGSPSCYHTMLERVSLRNPKNTTFDYLFYNCNNLRQVIITGSTTLVTSTYSMFEGCYLLEQAPSFDTANVTNMTLMFASCYTLEQVPYYNTIKVNTMASMFSSCLSLLTVPLYNTAIVTDMSSMFNACRSLVTVPFYNTANVTNMSNMFNAAHVLVTVPFYNTANVTNMSNMFNACYALQDVPNFNTSKVTNASAMFSSCYSLKTVPSFNFASTGTSINMSTMFASCFSLVSIGEINTSNSNNMGSMFLNCVNLKTVPTLGVYTPNVSSLFQGCRSLALIPAINFLNGGLSSAFSTCNSLSKVLAFNLTGAISFSQAKLSKTSLETIFSNLFPGANTITITSNTGADTPISISCTSTAGSNIVTFASTSGLVAGMFITGTGTAATSGRGSVTFTDAGDLVNLTANGLGNGLAVSFSSVITTTGISINNIYYIINSNPNNFQLSLTPGGAAIALTNNGSGTIKYASYIVNVDSGTQITLSTPMSQAGTSARSFRKLDTSLALMKGWTVTG